MSLILILKFLLNRKDREDLERAVELISEKNGLSKRESEVLSLPADYCTYSEIGKKLYISLDTVKSHTKSIYKKTGTGSRSELIRRISDL